MTVAARGGSMLEAARGFGRWRRRMRWIVLLPGCLLAAAGFWVAYEHVHAILGPDRTARRFVTMFGIVAFVGVFLTAVRLSRWLVHRGTPGKLDELARKYEIDVVELTDYVNR